MISLLQLKRLGTSNSMKLPKQLPKLSPKPKSHSLKTTPFEKEDLLSFPEVNSNTLKPKKSSLKSKLSVLTEFGILPCKGLTITPKTLQKKKIDPKIKFFDLMGKKNAEIFFKRLDLDSIIESAKEELINEEMVKKLLKANRPNVFVQFEPENKPKIRESTYYKKRLIAANGPRNLLNRKKDVDKIDGIIKLCDQFKKENKPSHGQQKNIKV